MAILLPSDFDLRRLVDSERKVVQALVAGLDDSWFLVPSVEVSDGGQDGEIDIVLVSSEGGAFVIEVKGGLIRVEGDKWFSYDKQIQSPVAQVKRAKHLLVARLGTMKVRAPFLDHLVAFPDVNDVPETGIGDVVHIRESHEVIEERGADLHRSESSDQQMLGSLDLSDG